MDTPANSPVRFGVFELDARAGELRRSGRRVALQPQPLEILRALLERPGEVVTREELRRRLWTNGAYVDFDRSLNKAIVKLRDALGDDAESPRYIETLARHGYRFIPLAEAHAHVDGAPPAAEGAPAATMPRPQGPAWPEPSPISRVQPASARHRWRWAALGITLLALAAWFTGSWFRVQAPSHSGPAANVTPPNTVAFAPPPNSIAVLRFVNISGDKEQEYFSDGLTEELLNSLTHIDGLQVAARTSSFSFGEHPDIADVAHKLNVATVLEGSVRRSGHTMRITAQLNNAATGFHLWSQTYDRDISDVLKLQTEIATAVASALKVRLLGHEAARIQLGGTSNPAAFDAYLRASKAFMSRSDFTGVPAAIAAYTEAIRLDPNFALAYTGRSEAINQYTYELTSGTATRQGLARAEADARHAIALAPELALAHLALAYVFEDRLDFERASQEFEHARALAPGAARVLQENGTFAVLMGKTTEGLSTLRYVAMLDPLALESHLALANALYLARRYEEAVARFTESIQLAPDRKFSYMGRGLALYALGDLQGARASCEIHPEHWARLCLSIVYDKLGRHADAEAELKRFKSSMGEDYAYADAMIYAQWGDRTKALELLDKAVRLRDTGLFNLKTDPLMDPLRHEPRFQAIVRELKFPD